MKIAVHNNADGSITLDKDSFRKLTSCALMLVCLLELKIDETDIWTKASLAYDDIAEGIEAKEFGGSKFDN